MKKIFLLLLLIISISAKSQLWTNSLSWGNSFKRLAVTEGDTSTTKLAGALAVKDGILYVANGTRWNLVSSPIDTFLLSTRSWRQKGIDSIVSNFVPYTGATKNVLLGTKSLSALGITGESINGQFGVFEGYLQTGISNDQNGYYVSYNSNNAFKNQLIANQNITSDVTNFFPTKSGTLATLSDTMTLSDRIDARVKYTDTAAMLSSYLRIANYVPLDTTSLSNRIDARVKYTDTASMLSPYSKLKSVGLTMPSAFSVANSPLTSDGTLAVSGAGTASQYVRGDGQLANFPSNGGGGSSVNYYLNGSVNQGTFGGDTYYQLSKVPIIGAGTNFTRTNAQGNGYIASFITDAGDPALLNIPGGNWNLEFYFSASSGGSTPSFYAEIYKVSSSNVFTLIASGSTNPEGITQGTVVDQYFTSIPVPQTTILATDRIAIRIFVTTSGRTIILHTENSNLCEVLTTFSTGLNALNGLTNQVQYFATGTSGTDFNISSATNTHTFNLPTASATNRGVLLSSDWTMFNNKLSLSDTLTISTRAWRQKGLDSLAAIELNVADTATMLNPYTRGSGTSGQVGYWNATRSLTGSSVFTFTPTSSLLVNNSVTATGAIARGANLTPTLVAAANNDVLVGLDINPTFTNGAFTNVSNVALRFNGLANMSASTIAGVINVNNTQRSIFGQIDNKFTSTGAYLQFYGENNSLDKGSMEFFYNSKFGGSNTSVNFLEFDGTTATNRFKIFGGGNIGIGQTTDAGFKLDVNGTVRIQGNSTIIGGTSPNPYTSANRGSIFLNGTNNSLYGLGVGGVAKGYLYHDGTNVYIENSNSGGNFNLTQIGAGFFTFNTNGSERMRLFSTGNWGINTTTDAGFRLDVNGTARVQGNAQFGTGFYWDNANSRLGIGTSSPQNTFDVVRGTAGAMLRSQYESASFSFNADSKVGIYTASSNTAHGASLIFGQTNLQASSAYPSFEMQYVYSATVADNNWRLNYTGRNSSGLVTTFAANLFNVYADGRVILNPATSGVTASAKLLIGTSTDAGFRLDVNGTARVQGAATVSLNQNSSTILTVSNTTAGTGSQANLTLQSDATAGNGQLFKYSSSRPAYKTINSSDLGFYNATGGNISILNDNASGNINFTAGASSNAQLTIASSGNITQSVNQNASTTLKVSNTTSGTASESILLLTSNNGNFQFGKTSSTKTAFKTISANDGYIFNDVSGNISILNNFASGNINFAAGGSSNSQATLASTGNLLIGTTTDIASSKLTVESTTQGFLPPRMTTGQRDLISSPAAGLVIFNTTLNQLSYYNGTIWINL